MAAEAPARGVARSRPVAAVLALTVGGLGIHKAYLGRPGLAVVYLLLSWTGIPSFVAWVEGILYLLTSDEEWAAGRGGAVRHSSRAALAMCWLIVWWPFVAAALVVLVLYTGPGLSA